MEDCIVPDNLIAQWEKDEIGRDPYLITDLYPVYRDIVADAKPKSILEIGCRYGYSLAVALDAYSGIERAVSVDVVDDPAAYEPGDNGAFRIAQRNINAMQPGRWPNTKIEFYEQNTQHIQSFPFSGPFDLVYVDGDHSVLGMLHDLFLSMPLLSPEGIIVVDDMDGWPELYEPTKLFARAVGMTTRYYPDKAGRGRLVLSGYNLGHGQNPKE